MTAPNKTWPVLTGRARARRTWRGKLLLQVEACTDGIPMTINERRRFCIWRDATVADLPMFDKGFVV